MISNGITFKDNELSNLLSGNIVLNEVYIGKTKELLAAEQQLDKFRNKYMGKYVLNTKVNSDPDLLEFDRMMEKIFGFGCFTLHIHNETTCNAFTMPIDYRYDYANPGNNIIVDAKGFKFKTECDYACILGIYSGLIFNPNFSTPEIMSVLLHEVGHNFNSAINKPNGALVNFYITTCFLINLLNIVDPLAFADIIKNNNTYRKFVDKLGKQMRENNSMPVAVYDVFVQVMAIVKQCGGIITDAMRIISMGGFSIYFAIVNGLKQLNFNPINLIFKIFGLKIGYTSEQTADNFVTMYGYGGELSSAQTKLGGKESKSASTVMGKFDNIPIISAILHINEAPAFLLLGLFDEHPNDVSRIKDQIDMLKRELEKEDIDPKMRKYIESDIRACEEAFYILVDCSEGLNDPYIAKKIYNKMANNGNNFKGKLLGNKHKFEEYDKVFKNASK